MLLVLSAPSKGDPYYKNYFLKMIDFYVAYASAIHGHDNVIVLADKKTMPYLENRLPSEILLTIDEELDPWIRDVSPVIPGKSIQFCFCGGLKRKEAKSIQGRFTRFLKKYEIEYKCVEFLNDGGNFVYNNQNTLITTDKFLELNNLKEEDGIKVLKDVFEMDHVLIVPRDDEKLGHADGMCSFIDENTLVSVDYREDPQFQHSLDTSIKSLLKDNSHIHSIKVECPFSPKIAAGGFSSAFGIYVNCVPTKNFIYLPIFNHPLDEKALSLFKQNAGHREVIPVDVTTVCDLGGSLRCLSWEVIGENSEKLINAAKFSAPFGSERVIL